MSESRDGVLATFRADILRGKKIFPQKEYRAFSNWLKILISYGEFKNLCATASEQFEAEKKARNEAKEKAATDATAKAEPAAKAVESDKKLKRESELE